MLNADREFNLILLFHFIKFKWTGEETKLHWNTKVDNKNTLIYTVKKVENTWLLQVLINSYPHGLDAFETGERSN